MALRRRLRLAEHQRPAFDLERVLEGDDGIVQRLGFPALDAGDRRFMDAALFGERGERQLPFGAGLFESELHTRVRLTHTRNDVKYEITHARNACGRR